MTYITPASLWAQIEGVEAGVWLTPRGDGKSTEIVTKLYTPAIKALWRHRANAYLVVANISFAQISATFVGIRVDDDTAAPLLASCVVANRIEYALLQHLLRRPETRLHFLDEDSAPLLSAICRFNSIQLTKARDISVQPSTDEHIARSLHEIDQLYEAFRNASDAAWRQGRFHTREIAHVPIMFEFDQPAEVVTVHEMGREKFSQAVARLDNPDEGGALEASVYHALLPIYAGRAWRSSVVSEGNSRRELTDVLCCSSDHICLLECKVMPVLSTEPTRTSRRKIASIEKNILNALDQLQGAIRNVRSGSGIFDSSNREIPIAGRDTLPIDAIVLVSERHGGLNGDKLAAAVTRASQKYDNAFFHVLDLPTLHQLARYSHIPLLLRKNLAIQFDAVQRHKTVHVQGRFGIPHSGHRGKSKQ